MVFRTGEESPCTGIAILHEDIATVGEDGRIVLLSTRQDDPLRVIGKFILDIGYQKLT